MQIQEEVLVENEFKLKSSEMDENVAPFDGKIHYHLYPESNSEAYLDIQFAKQTLMTALVFEMDVSASIEKISVEVREAGIQYPDAYSFWGFHNLHFGQNEIPTDSSTFTRIAYLEPVIADRIKININQTAEEFIGSLKILGLPWEKLNKADPVLEPRAFEDEFWIGGPGPAYENVISDQGFCPHGSALITGFVTRAVTAAYQNGMKIKFEKE